MLSVLIPVYRRDVRALAVELHRQCSELKIPFEVFCLDDGSDEITKVLNRKILNLPHIRYEELEKNVGRSAIRNELVRRAKFEWFWFLDCDADAAVNKSLAANFWRQKDKNTLVSGGRIYQENKPADPALFLHWLWGSEKELIDPQLRMKNPVTAFLSNNFFLHRSVCEAVPFDESLDGYGYEDTLFAAEIVQRGFIIKHIKNPVMHIGLEPADQFLKKIEESLLNLLELKEICRKKGIDFPVKSKLNFAFNVLNFPLIRPFVSSYFIGKLLKQREILLGKNPDLQVFNSYRLGYLLKEGKRIK